MTKAVFTGSRFGLAPERTARRNQLEADVFSVFEQYGYSEISLPIYEYYSVLKDTSYNFKDENIISFTDRSSGRSLVLRPDFTPQVSRMVAGYKDSFPVPVRVYYRGTVFRNVNMDQGAKAEKYQIGCELYGVSELDGDRELILCLNSCMEKIGMADFLAVFGDAAYMSRVLALLKDKADDYMELLTNKKIYATQAFVKKLDPKSPFTALLKGLPLLFGGAKELKKLQELSAFDPLLSERAAYIRGLFSEAVRYGVREDSLLFDPAEMRGLEYYTGVSFEIIHPATGNIIGGGGRYDSLMQKFNLHYTACGMGIYLSEIEEHAEAERTTPETDWIVIGEKFLEEAQKLRKEGRKVIHIYNEKDAEHFLRHVNAKNILR